DRGRDPGYRRRSYRKRIRGCRRLSRDGRGRNDRRARRDRECDLRCAIAARHQCFDFTNDSGTPVQAAGEGTRENERKPGMNDLAGRVALVTGGGRDVGAAISRALAEEGAAVAVNYHHSREQADAVVAQIQKAGGKAKAYQADIANFEAVKG